MQKKNKGEKSRDKIIETAIELFSDQGFSGTSVQDIADICQISQTTIFYHFKTKKVLFSEILKFVIKNNRNIFEVMEQEIEDPFEKLIVLLEANMEWCVRFPAQTKIVLLLFQFSASDDEMKELATLTIDKGRDLVLSQLQLIREDQLQNRDINIEDLSIIIQQYVNAAMFQYLVRSDKESVYLGFKSNLRAFLKLLICP